MRKTTAETAKLNDKTLEKALHDALTARLNEAYDNEIRPKLIQDLDARKSEIIAGLVLHLLREVSIEQMGNIMKIEVRTDVYEYK